MKLLRILLLPFSLLYGCIVWVRNKLYDGHFISVKHFDLPIISVGNLSAGGTGKSPHVEYLIRLLNGKHTLATLSRGYGRSTEGFIISSSTSKATEIGDEPRQFKSKFPDITVAVDAKRVNGITQLLTISPPIHVVILDDAFQHRSVMPGLSILLTDYNKLYCDDVMLPSGTLREFKCGAKRADIIIVTKCPNQLSNQSRQQIIQKLHTLQHQKIYFSFIQYGHLVAVNKKNTVSETALTTDTTVVLLTGIANPKPMADYLTPRVKTIVPARFADHHEFNQKDITSVLNIFNTIASDKKIIVTTEKDWMRLESSDFANQLLNLPLFYLPIEIDFSETDKLTFNNQISEYVKRN